MCNGWNVFEERKEVQAPSSPLMGRSSRPAARMVSLQNYHHEKVERICSTIGEFDRVLGGGIVPGSLIILTGDPGIGKSTLLLQVSHRIAQNHTVYYVSTEESVHQVSQRAHRLGCTGTQLLFSDEASIESIIAAAQQGKPALLIIDSIQNCYASSTNQQMGGVAQLREITFQLMRFAKESGVSVLLSGHITKEGVIAGPKTLEHMVDAVFYLQVEDQWQTRILRAVKNRFGTINELGFFEMHAGGLQEIHNINTYVMNEYTNAPGSVLVSSIEGSRPLLLELQALTIESKFGMPQRVISGVNHKQVMLIAAILQKYLHIPLNTHDIFFKVSGGFTLKESTSDLGIALVLLSSYFQQPLPEKSIALGEISLTGHIKPITQISVLLKEAQKFGIKQLLVADNQKIDSNVNTKRFGSVYELLSLFTV